MKRLGFELITTRARGEVPGWPATYEWELQENPEGEYVLHSEAQARIEVYRKALRELMDAIEYAHATGSGLYPDIREMVNAKSALEKQP